MNRYQELLMASIHQRTTTWGKDHFIHKPDNLSEGQSRLWDFLTGQNKLAGISDAERKELRETLSEISGIRVPEMTKRTIPTQVGIMVVGVPGQSNYPESPILNITTAQWLDVKGRRLDSNGTSQVRNEQVREATLEEIEWYVRTFPESHLNNLCINLKLLPKHRQQLIDLSVPLIMKATEETFASVIQFPDDFKVLHRLADNMGYSNTLTLVEYLERKLPVAKRTDLTLLQKFFDDGDHIKFTPWSAVLFADGDSYEKGICHLHNGKDNSVVFFKPNGYQGGSSYNSPKYYLPATEEQVRAAIEPIAEYLLITLEPSVWLEWLEDKEYDSYLTG